MVGFQIDVLSSASDWLRAPTRKHQFENSSKESRLLIFLCTHLALNCLDSAEFLADCRNIFQYLWSLQHVLISFISLYVRDPSTEVNTTFFKTGWVTVPKKYETSVKVEII